MIDEGFMRLIQSAAPVAAIAPAPSGYRVQVPDNSPLPAWAITFVGGSSEHTLLSKRGPRMARLQVDAFGARDGNGSDTVRLSKAIDDVLEGFYGPLPDTDHTGILSCLMETEPTDFFDSAGRSIRRMTEYYVCF